MAHASIRRVCIRRPDADISCVISSSAAPAARKAVVTINCRTFEVFYGIAVAAACAKSGLGAVGTGVAS